MRETFAGIVDGARYLFTTGYGQLVRATFRQPTLTLQLLTQTLAKPQVLS